MNRAIYTILSASVAAFIMTSAAAKGDPVKGKALAYKPGGCATCHGENGVSKTGDFPTLAGQYQDYLAYSLRMYRKASKGDKTGRTNAIMAGQAAALSDKDIADLAAFYSRQKALAIKY